MVDLKRTLGIVLILVARGALHAQYDSSYFTAYPRRLTTRFYFSQKYTALTLQEARQHYTLRYLPNTTLNMGVGATFKWFTLNLAYGWPFLNHEPYKGKTRYLDLQFHGYGPKFNLDFLGQFYKGFYLFPKGAIQPGQYYNRPDLKVYVSGASFQYVFNHRRYSFRSAELQNEWQKKSAGSPLLGVEVYGGNARSDSSLVPAAVNNEVHQRGEHGIDFFEMGINAGYAYYLVIAKRFFLAGSATGSLDYGFNVLRSDEARQVRYGFSPNYLIRLSTGYNSDLWAFSIFYVNSGVNMAGPNSGHRMTINTGNLRLNYVYRFLLSRKERKALEEVIK